MSFRFQMALAVGLAGLLIAPLQAAESQPRPRSDPNERICEKVPMIGSRLGSKQVCMTRAEWEERRRTDRESIDRAQMSPNGPCTTVNTRTGAPAC
jgi:hypothetical protein